ncbi:MAG TPA: SDR family NAD(P)-dependent oxidoreductase [Woeseiaceae bacterium]|nr:SDR family NAD(P)-dependent oxidoreductase [Woeseiaceae bacterium]
MALLSSFRSHARAAVIGASGGIGRAFVELLAADANVRSVSVFSRSCLNWDSEKVNWHSIDVTDESSVAVAAEWASRDSLLDLVIVATGILHREDQILPERSLREIDPRAMAEVLTINAIGPVMVAKHFLPALSKDNKSVLAVLSARVGSISDNRLGGWMSYRMSKAALNMSVRTLAIEQARLNPASVVLALHPGTVDTALSKPFTERVDSSRLFSPAVSAGKLLKVIDDSSPDCSGGLYAYDGSRIEF